MMGGCFAWRAALPSLWQAHSGQPAFDDSLRARTHTHTPTHTHTHTPNTPLLSDILCSAPMVHLLSSPLCPRCAAPSSLSACLPNRHTHTHTHTYTHTH